MLIVWQLPVNVMAPMAIAHGGKVELLLVIPEVNLPQAALAIKPGEEGADGLLDLKIGSDRDAGLVLAHEANRNPGEDFSAHDFLTVCFLGALTQDAKFEFTHGSFETEKEAVIELAGIIDALVIDYESVGENAEVNEVVPVAVVAGEAGGFQGEDRSDFSVADGTEKSGKAGSFPGPAAGDAKIIINDDNGLKAELLLPKRSF